MGLMFNPGWRAVVATNLSNTSRGAPTLNKIASSAVHSCQKQILAEELSNGLSRNRGFVTSAARLSDDKKAADQASLTSKIDPKDAAAKKASEEATKKAHEKKKKDDAKKDEPINKAEKEAKATKATE